jgi:hypothetical protein
MHINLWLIASVFLQIILIATWGDERVDILSAYNIVIGVLALLLALVIHS